MPKRVDTYANYTPVTESGCWLWLGSWDGRGYGVICPNRSTRIAAHRGFFEHYVSKIPFGLLVCHKCDTPSCVNPGHLFLGTQKDNINDMISKGRRPKRRPPIWLSSGRKLTDSQAREIFFSNKSYRKIAAEHKTSLNTISMIKNRRLYLSALL